jgi:hypothetical protein
MFVLHVLDQFKIYYKQVFLLNKVTILETSFAHQLYFSE